MRFSSPNALLLGVVLLCLSAASLAVGLSARPTWLGLELDAARDSGVVTVRALTPGGPAAAGGVRIGDRLTGIARPDGGVQPIVAQDLDEESYARTQRGVDEAMGRFDRLARAIEAQPPRLYLTDPAGRTRTVQLAARQRPLTSLGAEFWANLAFGLIATLICGWVWALRPGERATQLFALTGLSMLAFTAGWAVHATIEVAAVSAILTPVRLLNMGGAVAYGGAMIALFLCYPRRITRLPLLLAAPLAVLAWALTPLLPSNPPLGATGGAFTVWEMVGIIVAIGVQYGATRADPAARAVTRWLGLSVILGAGAFIGTVAAPGMMGHPPLVDPRFSLGFFVIIYVGMAVGLTRYRLFELDQWAFRILFYVGAGLALLAVDALLLLGLRASPETSLGAALLLVAFAYLPLRDVIWRRTVGQRKLKEHEMFAALADVALTPQADLRAERWRALLARVYEPLEIVPYAGSPPARVEIAAEGIEMRTPAAAGAPALTLRYPWRGRGLFGPAHLKLAGHLIGLLAQIEAGRDAYARGVVEERLRIARDLHDDVGARLLTGLHRNDLTQTREAMRGAIGDLRSIVSGLSGHDLPLEDVLADLRHETAERLAAAGLALDWPADESVEGQTLAPYRVYKNLTSACREIVSNAIRHAQATQVTVTVDRSPERLEMTISDDGVGLPQDPGGRRSGLVNLQRRIVELGGSVTFPPSERGAVVRLYLPLAPELPE